ncbi:TPA: glycoside hydrolase family 9, partial [Candidatus Marinimicrobia bacterium]|nr:glycoside hydrolase family 9 [Candidatus Neomarinimicrobiota bacterium]
KWGLDWMLRMHPEPDQLFHQIADDRDHIGFKYPYKDSSDYGWGPESYRIVYYATGKPQGLGRFTNTSTGLANLAGRYAAVMARAARIWKEDLNQPGQAEVFLKAGEEV